MPRVRRTEYAFFYCQDRDVLDIPRLLRGEAVLEPEQQILALSILTGEAHPITTTDLELLVSIPAKAWTDVDGDDPRLHALALNGLVVTDATDVRLSELRQRRSGLVPPRPPSFIISAVLPRAASNAGTKPATSVASRTAPRTKPRTLASIVNRIQYGNWNCGVLVICAIKSTAQ